MFFPEEDDDEREEMDEPANAGRRGNRAGAGADCISSGSRGSDNNLPVVRAKNVGTGQFGPCDMCERTGPSATWLHLELRLCKLLRQRHLPGLNHSTRGHGLVCWYNCVSWKQGRRYLYKRVLGLELFIRHEQNL